MADFTLGFSCLLFCCCFVLLTSYSQKVLKWLTLLEALVVCCFVVVLYSLLVTVRRS